MTTHAQRALAPDIVIVNAAVHTVDASLPKAEALAIAGQRIVAVGTTADIRPLAGAGTRLIDARGRSVLPGFRAGARHSDAAQDVPAKHTKDAKEEPQ